MTEPSTSENATSENAISEQPTFEQPTRPADGECCESECSPCVWDTYYEEMRLWREQEAKRKAAEQA